MRKLILGLLLGVSFLLIPWVFAQDSDVLVSPPTQDQGSNQDNTGNSKHQQVNSSNSEGSSQNSPNATVPQKKHKAPSQATIDACQDKSEGDSCEITNSHGTRAGICSYTSDKKYLFCKHNRKKKPA